MPAQLPVNENTVRRVVLSFKDQKSAHTVKKQLSDLSKRIDHTLQPVFRSRKIGEDVKIREPKPPLINQQKVQLFQSSSQFSRIMQFVQEKYPGDEFIGTMYNFRNAFETFTFCIKPRISQFQVTLFFCRGQQTNVSKCIVIRRVKSYYVASDSLVSEVLVAVAVMVSSGPSVTLGRAQKPIWDKEFHLSELQSDAYGRNGYDFCRCVRM